MKFILLILIIFVVSAGCNKIYPNNQTPNVQTNNYVHELKIKNSNLLVEVANTDSEKNLGLSGRKSLNQNQGMLFIFSPKIKPSFWMQDMLFDLDIIWIENNRIIDITPNVPAPKISCLVKYSNCSPLPTYSPSTEVDMVLEVNSSWVKNNNINIGDPIEFKN